MDDRLQRSLSALVGLAVVVVLGWITLDMFERGPRRPAHDEHATAEAEASASPTPSAAPSASAAPASSAAEAADAGVLPSVLLDVDAGDLPNGAPRTVKLGVVLVQWGGAEGAPANGRSKAAARTMADKLEAEAQTDFHAAVQHGDQGSSEDVGRIPRGVLDPRTEVAVFSLAKGAVSGVLETPRGYWIVKRAD